MQDESMVLHIKGQVARRGERTDVTGGWGIAG